MSEKKIRYFQAEDRVVARAMSSESQSRLAADPYYTEVQVVPVDAIVIRDEQLTTFEAETVDGRTYWNQPGLMGSSHEDSRDARALEHEARLLLAKAKYLREHPPVDEEQVKAVADLISEAVDSGISVNATDGSLERFLVERGVRVEAKS